MQYVTRCTECKSCVTFETQKVRSRCNTRGECHWCYCTSIPLASHPSIALTTVTIPERSCRRVWPGITLCHCRCCFCITVADDFVSVFVVQVVVVCFWVSRELLSVVVTVVECCCSSLCLFRGMFLASMGLLQP